ncbi:hypothetical protein ACIPRL_35485 [Streptomyces sp. NPDC090085]|uniref:hypothetical protein n=1 Tax=Streptomyces sp. NPDC090085 TaxID=3365943 RepID=UPI0037F4B341
MKKIITAATLALVAVGLAAPAHADDNNIGALQGMTVGSDGAGSSDNPITRTTDINIEKTPNNDPNPGLVQELVKKLTG